MSQIDKHFGKGSVMRLGSDERAQVAVIPTGSIALDVALGIGGLPRGRVVEIYGPESSGKTTLTLHAIANAQAAGVSRRSSTLSMPSTRITPKRSASTSTPCWCPSQTRESRHSKSPICSSGPARSTS